jgi:23S rRNA (guanine745-N1)-methyltransferase
VLADVLGYLRCPHCHTGLALVDGTARCERGHAFDVARQGYLSLLAGGALPQNGDTAAMVAARQAFLGGGHYRFLADALAALAPSTVAGASAGCVLDVGGGTGYHLAAVLDALPGYRGIVLDVSKYAARQAVRAHPRAEAVVADAWQPLPVRTGAAALVLNVFAPRDGAELHRVLRPGGALVVVTPTAEHLRELRGPLGLIGLDPRKDERLADKLARYFTPVAEAMHTRSLSLSHADLAAVVGMGPSARHRGGEPLAAAIGGLPEPCPVTASFRTVTYRSVG